MPSLSYTKLTPAEIESNLASLSGWLIQERMLAKEFAFESYASGVMFAAAVGHVADKLNHHPDLQIGYKKVAVATITHDSGGLTSYDFELARRIESLL